LASACWCRPGGWNVRGIHQVDADLGTAGENRHPEKFV